MGSREKCKREVMKLVAVERLGKRHKMAMVICKCCKNCREKCHERKLLYVKFELLIPHLSNFFFLSSHEK